MAVSTAASMNSSFKSARMSIQMKPRHTLAPLAMACLLLTGCGGGGDGPAIKAYPQSIRFGAAPPLPLNGTASVLASASTGLAIRYSSLTPTVCSVHSSSGLVTDYAPGSCVIAAEQAGNSDFAPAAQVTQSLLVVVDPAQTLSFGPAPSLSLYGTASVSASASSGLQVAFSSATPAVCRVHSSTGLVTNIAAGNCTVLADQSGDAHFNAAQQVSQTLVVSASMVMLTPPGAPTGVGATLGSSANTVVLSFVGPSFSGGSPVTAYSVASNSAGVLGTGPASPLTISCPGSCAGHAFTVRGSNVAGDGAISEVADILTQYKVTSTFYEPDTQPNNSVFTGSFTLNSTTGTVSNLSGTLTESMTHINDGIAMTTVPLHYQLASVSDGAGGMLLSTFALNTTQTFAEGGFAPGSPGLYFGWPTAPSPDAGGIGNAYAMVYVNLLNPGAALTPVQINKLAYADCTPGGMMGDTCMTAYWGRGTMGGYPVSQTITRP
jgi:hypothetical protein